MFDEVMGDTAEILARLQEQLLQIEKNYQKINISTYVASRCLRQSKNQQEKIKKKEQAKVTALKAQSQTFAHSFSIAAKGQWVNKAQEELKKVVTELEDL